MIQFKVSIQHTYVAAGALISAHLIQRPLINPQWDSGTAFIAGLSDLAILAALSLTHWLVCCGKPPASRTRAAFAFIHAALALSIIAFATFSQVLFIKTGESLDLAIIEFGLQHWKELTAVAAGEITLSALQPFLLAIVFLILAAASPQRRTTHYLTRSALALPILLLPGCNIAYSLMDTSRDANFVIEGKQQGLYQGAYARLSSAQLSWNDTPRQAWSMGILSGIAFGAPFGNLEFATYRQKAGGNRAHDISGATPTEMENRPNVLMVLLESVRHDVLGAYRSDETNTPTHTPFLDAFAKQAQVVERAYTTIPHTSKALVGIYCGTFPRFEPAITEALPQGLDTPCLPQLLATAGYSSAHFQTAPAAFEHRTQLLENMGFDYFTTQENFLDGPWERFGYLGLDDRAMMAPAINWMKKQRQAEKPFFASLLTIATHHPYSYPGNVKAVSDPREAYQAYVGALRYTDTMLEALFSALEQEGLLENTMVIITGDHGEGFGEHGQLAHNGTAYEEGKRVPLLIRAPGAAPPTGRIDGLRQHIDILPTVLEAAGVAVQGTLAGKSLWASQGHDAIITSCFYKNYCLTHITASQQKLIYFYGRRNVELYDLASDPNERSNLYTPADGVTDLTEQRLLSAVGLLNSYDMAWTSPSSSVVSKVDIAQ
jgi:lipoteichoic acid synthase